MVALAMLLVSCRPEAEKPTVFTKSVGEITETTAKVVGQVTSDGGAIVTERGVCWNTEGTPEVIDYRTVDGKGVGTYENARHKRGGSSIFFSFSRGGTNAICTI